MKLAYSIRSLLAIVLTFASALTVLVMPRIMRQRAIEKLEKEPLVSNILGMGIVEEPTRIDKLLGFRGGVDHLHFESRDDGKEVLRKEVFETARLLSPLTELAIERVNVEPCNSYPFAEKLLIRNVDGRNVTEWLRGLLLAQVNLKEIEVEWTPKFSDEHLEILCSICGLKSISLAGTSVTGTGFRKRDAEHELELRLVDCPITDDGLRAIVECTGLRNLLLDFSPKMQCPDLRLLLRAPKSLNLIVGVGCRSDNPDVLRISKELDNYFGFRTVYFQDSSN